MTTDELIAHYRDSMPAASDEMAVRLEEYIGAKLPADYRSFLGVQNGGSLDEQLVASFSSTLYAGGQGNAIVERFFSLVESGEVAVRPVRSFLSEIGHKLLEAPKQMIVIADDFSGNVITLDLRPATYGQIGLIDHELIGEKFDDAEGYQIVASSFSNFVGQLNDAEEELPSEVTPERLGWNDDRNHGIWVMLGGLTVALIALWALGGLEF